jgi:hypothetical protein
VSRVLEQAFDRGMKGDIEIGLTNVDTDIHWYLDF